MQTTIINDKLFLIEFDGKYAHHFKEGEYYNPETKNFMGYIQTPLGTVTLCELDKFGDPNVPYEEGDVFVFPKTQRTIKLAQKNEYERLKLIIKEQQQEIEGLKEALTGVVSTLCNLKVSSPCSNSHKNTFGFEMGPHSGAWFFEQLKEAIEKL